MKNFTLLVVLLFSGIVSVKAQDFSNKGKDFWLGYGYHVRYVTGNINSQDMVLYFATENVAGRFTNIKIEIPALGYVENLTNVPPGSIVESSSLPKNGSLDSRLTTEGLFNTGIHVTADRPVVAYCHIYDQSVSGATVLFPTNTLGKEYYCMNYDQVSNEGSSNSFFFVVATDTGTTTVEITPSAQTLTHPAGVPFTVTLSQGEIYNVMGRLSSGGGNQSSGVDLSGSKIRSINNGASGCKKIAVFSGSGKVLIGCNGNYGQSSADNLIAQSFPSNAWGKRFLTTPTQNMPFNPYRIGVSNPAAVVRVNGVIQTGLVNNFYYDIPATDEPLLIESTEPIMVAQYITTRGACGNNFIGGLGDPEMIYLSPVEQTIEEVILNSTDHFAITQHWINVVLKTAAVPSFSITGSIGSYSFLPHPGDASYSYAQIRVSAGAHTLTADSGFNAIAYGYGSAETYGYNAGTNLKDLYNFVEPLNPLNITGTNSACACTPFYFTITYPYQPLSLKWDFKGYQTNVTDNSPVPDSTYLINGKQVWRYKLPTPYTYCPAGNYPLSVTAGTPGTDGCGNTQTKDDTLFVRTIPTPDISWQHNGCVSDSVRFSDVSIYEDGVYSYSWSWDFGDGTTSTDPSPVHKYSTPGTYRVKYSFITNIGCISAVKDTVLIVSGIPVAAFGVSSSVCRDKAATFSDSSSVASPGTIALWVWDFGDGNVVSATDNSNQLHTYLGSGPITASLQIVTPSGCRSAVFNKTFTVNPTPEPDFVLPSKVCLPYDAAVFTDASTIADGSQASFTWKWKFGEPSSGPNDSAATKNGTHVYSTGGPFTVRLTVTSAAGCVGDTSKVFNNVYAKATADFTVNPENCLTAVTNVSSNSSGQGNTITSWNWTFGDASTGTGQNTSHTYSIADTFSIAHWIMTDKGCYSDTISKNVIVNPLPVADFSVAGTACTGNVITFNNLSQPGAGAITAATWNFGNGRPDSVVNNNLPVSYRYNNTGNYTITLGLLTDKGCRSKTPPFSKTITVNPLPKPGFVAPEVCLTDASALFTDTSSVPSGTITTWAWNFGDPGSGINNTSAVQNATHHYTAIGLYTATLTVTSNLGCVDSVRQSFTVNGDIPSADFTVQTTPAFCANDSVTITDGSSVNFGNITKVEIYWDNAGAPTVKQTDDLPVPGKVYRHKYPDFQSPLTKTFSVRYLAYSGTDCVDERIRTVTVHASPKVRFNTVAPVCLDAAGYQITEASETGGVPGTAVFTGTGVNSAGLFNPSLTGAGSFTVLYTYTSQFGCVDTASNTVVVLAPAIANFGYSKPSCERNPIVFTDSSSIPTSSGTITSWRWNFGDGTPPVTNNTNAAVSHQFTSYNTYTVTLTVTSSNGCTVQKQKPVTVNPLPQPGFRFPSSACLPNAAVSFTDTSSIADGTQNSFTYAWRFDDPGSANNTSVSKNPTHVFSAARTYAITLTCTSGEGCRDSVTIPMNIIHPQPVAGISSDSTSICENQTVKFSDNSTGADGVVNKWTWDFDNGNSSVIQFPSSQTYTTAKTYRVQLQIENSFGCKDTAVNNFRVFANPVMSAGPDQVLLEGGEITLDASASGSGLRYLWQTVPPGAGNYLNNTAVLKPVIKGITDDITYQLLVVADGGCYKMDSVFIKLLKAPVIPNTFTPNDDNINETWVIQYLESYPECRIKIFNRDGQVVYESLGYKAPGWNGTYKGKKVPFGTYYYIIEPGSGRKPITGYVTVIY